MKIVKNYGKFGNLISAVLLLALFVCLLLPFWNTGAEWVSVGSYMGFPSEHTGVTEYLQQQVGENFTINDLVLPFVIMFVCSAGGTIFCLIKKNSGISAILPVICGVSGIISYLTVPALQVSGLWIVHFLLCVLMLASGVMTFITWNQSDYEAE